MVAIPYPSTLPVPVYRSAIDLDVGSDEIEFDSGNVRQYRLAPEVISHWRLEWVMTGADREAWWAFCNAAAWEPAGIEILGEVLQFVSDATEVPAGRGGDAWRISVEAVTVVDDDTLRFPTPVPTEYGYGFISSDNVTNGAEIAGTFDFTNNKVNTIHYEALSLSASDWTYLELYFPLQGWAPANIYAYRSHAFNNGARSSAEWRPSTAITPSGTPNAANRPMGGEFRFTKLENGEGVAFTYECRTQESYGVGGMSIGGGSIADTELPTAWRLLANGGGNITGRAVCTGEPETFDTDANDYQGPWVPLADESGAGVTEFVVSGLPAHFVWRVEVEIWNTQTNLRMAQIAFGTGPATFPTGTFDFAVYGQVNSNTGNILGTGVNFAGADAADYANLCNQASGNDGLGSEAECYGLWTIDAFEPGRAEPMYALVDGSWRRHVNQSPYTFEEIFSTGCLNDNESAARTSIKIKLDNDEAFDCRVRVKGLNTAFVGGQARVEHAYEEQSGVGSFSFDLDGNSGPLHTIAYFVMDSIGDDKAPRMNPTIAGGENRTKYYCGRHYNMSNGRFSSTSGASSGDDDGMFFGAATSQIRNGKMIGRMRMHNTEQTTNATTQPICSAAFAFYYASTSRVWRGMVTGHRDFDLVAIDAMTMKIEDLSNFDIRGMAYTVMETEQALEAA